MLPRPQTSAWRARLATPVALLALLPLIAGCSGSASGLPAPAPTVDVDMSEYRFDLHGDFVPGRTVVRVHNKGSLEHQAVLMYLDPALPPIGEQLKSSERVVVPTIVSLKPRGPGQDGTFAVDLDPGRYAFVCFVQDPDGTQHAIKGMSAEFRVA